MIADSLVESLKDYFSQFGEVVECTVMRDGPTGRSRGFGFLTFKDPKTVNIVMVKEHFLDGKIVSGPGLLFLLFMLMYNFRLIRSVLSLEMNRRRLPRSSSAVSLRKRLRPISANTSCSSAVYSIQPS